MTVADLRRRQPLTKRASTSMLVPTSTGLLQKPVGVSGGRSNVHNATKCVLTNTILILIKAVQKQFLFIDQIARNVFWAFHSRHSKNLGYLGCRLYNITDWASAVLAYCSDVKVQKDPVLAAIMQIFIDFRQGPPSIWQGPRHCTSGHSLNPPMAPSMALNRFLN